MKPEIKQKWVAALRSGQYSQATGRLRRQDAYCCLGVLCDLYQKETGDGQWVPIDPITTDGYDFLNSNALVPTEVQRWAGLPSADPSVPVPGLNVPRGLAYLNDNGNKFTDIADIIEKEL